MRGSFDSIKRVLMLPVFPTLSRKHMKELKIGIKNVRFVDFILVLVKNSPKYTVFEIRICFILIKSLYLSANIIIVNLYLVTTT